MLEKVLDKTIDELMSKGYEDLRIRMNRKTFRFFPSYDLLNFIKDEESLLKLTLYKGIPVFIDDNMADGQYMFEVRIGYEYYGIDEISVMSKILKI